VTRYLVTGGAGFIGSHVTRRLARQPDARIVVFDNLCSGRREHLDEVMGDGRVEIVLGDLKDVEALVAAAEGIDHAFHFAANPDIAKAMAEPSVDFWEGTYLTQNLLEALRRAGVGRLTYASGSGVYGDVGELPVVEDMPLRPVSPYGASKLACEALIGTYCHMFGMRALALRFANVVGPQQTHGVAYDFIRRLRARPEALDIMGDGSQSKSYVHVDDVVDALLGLFPTEDGPQFEVLNIATEDYLTVREIAGMVADRLGLSDVEYRFGDEPRGWRGDVPVVRFDSARARARGWANARTSREAMAAAIDAMIHQLDATQAGRASA
jgi:UDP-glucose 4-epimerase